MKVKVMHVSSAPETVDVKGVPVEMQSCYIADHTDRIKVQLWETQVGALVRGQSYDITNVSTREFGGDLYLTTTRSSELKEVAALSGQSLDVLLTIDEGEAKTLTGHVTGAEVSVRRRCVKCSAWQANFEGKGKFHRCERCGLLQRVASFLPTVTAKVSLSGDFGEEDFKVPNSVLKHHLEKEGLLELLADRQNVEEHLFEIGLCTFKMQNSTVIALSKVEQAVKPVAEGANLLGEPEATEMDSWLDDDDQLLDEPVPTGI